MPLQSGKSLGPYRITRLLGAGGMGEVYEATDTRLDRRVAVKVLPEPLTSDRQSRERFEREARAVSSLNHPCICTLHDVGEQDGVFYLVMELIDGETLESRLTRGRLPLKKILEYSVQIADALDKAHRQGIVHRDLKPSNIMLTASGVKLMDFGLAKLKKETAPISNLSKSTRDGPLTMEGTILGTVQYMAPEQLEGEPADARSDIFSFGAILYEMLSGQRPFQGTSTASLMASILTAEPPSPATPDTPPGFEQLVRVCLAKKPEDRWQTAHDVGKQLEWILASHAAPAAPAPTLVQAGSRRFKLWAGLGILLVIAALGLTYRDRSVSGGQPMQFAVSLPDDVLFSVGEDFFRSAIISPDGQRIVFTGVERASGKALLFVRPIDSVDATPLHGTEDGNSIFWSPDSDSVGFVAEGKLKVVKVTGGDPREIVATTGNAGATWNEDDTILASLKNPGPIFRIPLAGGAPVPATSLDTSVEIDHQWPQFLDDGEHFLFMATGRTAADNKVFASSLTSQTRNLLLEGVSAFAYAAPHHLIYLRNGTLWAQAFHTSRFELEGAPVSLARNALPPFSASRTGAVTYRTNPPTPHPLLWIGTDGTVLGTALPPGYYTDPVISPDGNEVALATRESIQQPFYVSVLNLTSGVSRTLTVGDANTRSPVWSPDGKTIVFLSLRSDAPGMYRKSANGVGTEELLLPFPGGLWPYQWPGEGLMYFAGSPGAFDIWMMSPASPDSRTPLIRTPANDVDGAVSPDGKWLIYSTNETGRWELFLTTFPPSSTKLPVTRNGGTDPLWGRDGKKLFYVKAATAELFSIPVTPGSPPQFGAPTRIYSGPLEYPSGHSFAVDPRRDRILVAPSSAPRGDINVLLNWKSLPAN